MTFEQTIQAHTEALNAHTAALRQFMSAANEPIPAPVSDTPKELATAPAVEQPSAEDLRMELRTKLVEISKSKGKDASFAVLQGFNVEKLPHLRDEDLGQAIAAADKALAA